MAAQNFSFVLEFSQNGGFSALGVVFLEENVPTRRKWAEI